MASVALTQMVPRAPEAKPVAVVFEPTPSTVVDEITSNLDTVAEKKVTVFAAKVTDGVEIVTVAVPAVPSEYKKISRYPVVRTDSVYA